MTSEHRVADLTGSLHREKLARKVDLELDWGAKYENWGLVTYFLVLLFSILSLVYFYWPFVK